MRSRYAASPLLRWLVPLSYCCLATCVVAKSPSKFTLPGRPYERSDDSEKDGWMGAGREFDLFDTRGGQESTPPPSIRTQPSTSSGSSSSGSHVRPGPWTASPTSSATRKRRSSYSGSSSSRRSYRSSSSSRRRPDLFHNVQEWWSNTIGEKDWPKLQIRVEPTTTIKIRKTFHPLKTIVRLGAEFNTQLGVWQFKSSWEDAIIGGKLTLKGRELQLSKSWQLSVGAVEDLVTRLRFRAAVDLGTMKAYARVGFRTERLSPINVSEGFTLIKRLPLVGKDGKAKLEVKANFAIPEPEIEYSTEGNRSMVGMGDIEVNIEELNLLLDY